MQTTNNYLYLIVIVALVLVAGIGEFLHLLPAGTFYSVFFLAVGIIIPSPILHPTTPIVGPNTNVQVSASEPTAVIDRSRG